MAKNRKKIKILYLSLIILIISFAIVAFTFKTIYFNRIFINLTLMFSSIIMVMMISIFIVESLKTNQENDFKYITLMMSFIVLVHEIFLFWQYRDQGLGLMWNLVIIDLVLLVLTFHLVVVSLHNLIQNYINLEVAFHHWKEAFLMKFLQVFSLLVLFFINIVLIFNNKVKQLIRSWSSTYELIITFKVVLLIKYMKNQLSCPKLHTSFD